MSRKKFIIWSAIAAIIVAVNLLNGISELILEAYLKGAVNLICFVAVGLVWWLFYYKKYQEWKQQHKGQKGE